MQLIDDLTNVNLDRETVLTIGAFDGIHRGHQQLIGRLVQRARQTERLSGLITFHPHPSAVLSPRTPTCYLTTPGEKAALLEKLNLDAVAILSFNREMANMPARDFVALICRHLHMTEMWVGQDFALGRAREGDANTLTAIGQEMGFAVQVVQPFVWEGQIVSSTRIRALLHEGRVRQASGFLGRYYSLAGEVVPGARRGRRLGFPTANLEVRAERAVPANGIYATFAVLGSERYPAVTNIGTRPSFDNGEPTVETHILDFDEDIYGCDLVVEFVEYLRPEKRFDDIDDLIVQINRDVRLARGILSAERQWAGFATRPGEAASKAALRDQQGQL